MGGAVLPRANDNNIVLGARLVKRGGRTQKNIVDVLARTFITGEWKLGVLPGAFRAQPAQCVIKSQRDIIATACVYVCIYISIRVCTCVFVNTPVDVCCNRYRETLLKRPFLFSWKYNYETNIFR